jgi:hypothetical protein
MRELVKLLLIPIAGCIAIGVIFLFIVFGGHFENKVDNEQGKLGHAVAELGAFDDIIGQTAHCDNTLYQPVCGEDGKTYDNVCYAITAGTKVAHHGACGPRT